ncbi:paramyosin-like [Montipora foliosa]|uniref:paramyosin-like n=1 Tax=Montipora foliosa TaxID=591990 RepID=UPI0035F1FA8E
MDLRDCAVIDRHYPKLQQCLEPTKLLRYLENAGVLDEDDVETIREEKRKSSRENQVAIFIDILKRREHGFRHLLQALLKSKVQEFLARELLEDDVYDEEEINSILSELENDIDETQSLKLRLVEEKKRHRNTRKELEDIRRSSIVFSDSSSSGLFADYDSNLSEDNEFGGNVSLEGEEQRGEATIEGNMVLINGFMPHRFQNTERFDAFRDALEWEHEDGWKQFGSADHLDILSRKRTGEVGWHENLRKSSSLGTINETGRRRSEFARYGSEEDLKYWEESVSSRLRGEEEVESLEDKVALLEKQLQAEKRRREVSEHEVAKLQSEREELCAELEETRDQLRESQLNLFYEDDDYEEELCLKHGDDGGDPSAGFSGKKKVTVESEARYLSANSEMSAARCHSPEFNKLQSQTERLKRTRLTSSWRSVNSQFYELDEYDDEIKVELDPSNFFDTLRQLKACTNSLYHEILNERDELQYLKRMTSTL